MSRDLELAEILAARLCHDLVGPIGAVANGVELLADDTSAVDPEVTGLIAASARQATRRLQWFRVAFGSGASLPAGSMFAEARRLTEGLFAEGRAKLDWPAPDAATEALATRPAAKLALNLSLAALEALPRGGTIQVRLVPGGAGLSIVITALGAAARLPEDIAPAFADNVAVMDLSPKAIPAYVAAQLARQDGGRISVRTLSPEQVEFAAALPGSASTKK